MSALLPCWAHVELLGHRQRDGYVTETEIAGTKLLRIDIPTSDTDTRIECYAPAALYGLSPITEIQAREANYRRAAMNYLGRHVDNGYEVIFPDEEDEV